MNGSPANTDNISQSAARCVLLQITCYLVIEFLPGELAWLFLGGGGLSPKYSWNVVFEAKHLKRTWQRHWSKRPTIQEQKKGTLPKPYCWSWEGSQKMTLTGHQSNQHLAIAWSYSESKSAVTRVLVWQEVPTDNGMTLNVVRCRTGTCSCLTERPVLVINIDLRSRRGT